MPYLFVLCDGHASRASVFRVLQGGIMTTGYIRYRSEYKYQLASDYRVSIPIRPTDDIVTDFVELETNGRLRVMNGYAWDGPSGPVIDNRENMRASLIHDALYQLMRNGELNARRTRKTADKIFRDVCKEDGVSSFKANLYYKALRQYGKPATSPGNKKRIRRAPRR
jgi:hypothetical protein